jgi:hypothetical protein
MNVTFDTRFVVVVLQGTYQVETTMMKRTRVAMGQATMPAISSRGKGTELLVACILAWKYT